ncbi:MAG: transposase [Actinomycetota bacterium]|nr:transposase [Actinomycetota bacterium]
MLGVGIDWAEDANQVALGRPGEGIVEEFSIAHRPEAVGRLIERIGALESDPGEVRVAIETKHGHLVEALVEAGYAVVPVNPDLVARRRGPARKKDDSEDARILCLMAMDRHTVLRPLIPHGEAAAEIRAIARDDERASRDERRLLNRLRADLIAAFPEALHFASEDLGAPTFLQVLARYPTAEAARAADDATLQALFRTARHGWPDRAVSRLREALGSSQFVPKAYLVRAKADTIRLAATQLLALGAQRRAWERRMGQLLAELAATGGQDQGQAVPDGEIYLSFPGLGSRLAARVAGEIGDHLEQFSTPNSLQCYGGKAPVTRRSGKSEFVVACRQACNRHLANAVQQWAFCSLSRSGWAREFYDAQRARGKTHHAALRALGNRWLEVLWHCLRKGVSYDEATHVANRERALKPVAA